MGLSPYSNEVLTVALVLLFLSSTVLCDCSTPTLPPHSSLRSGGTLKDSYPTGTVLQLTCIIGYEPIPGMPPAIACLPTGKWADTPTFCRGRRCPTPHVDNGRIVSSTDLRLGETVTFACDHGFRIIGDSTLRCVLKSGRVDWNRHPPHCQRIPCVRPPTISNGRYNPDPADEYSIGSAVIYRCDADYSLIGNSSITCIVTADGLNGEWNSRPPECKKVTCNRPNIPNGRLTTVFQPTYTYGTGISFQCNPGYTLVGAAFVRCGAKNTWNPPVPSCVKTVVSTTTKPGLPPPGHPAPPAVPPIFPVPPTPVPPEDETKEIPVLPTQSETIPTDESGSGKTVGIAIGVILAAIILTALIFASVKWIFCRRKADTPVSGKDTALEGRKTIDDLSPRKFQSKTSETFQRSSTSEMKMGTQ
ncbi:membrane cofactor protein-like [Python bivittatus]|uniref:Membrane cofactor protein-like n=1 Tax=Python bivittatus TaxID=176946 RepID=A0A9F5IYH7_PYTBI|nr:membrane cofactor protein-like [Python bivittatus]